MVAARREHRGPEDDLASRRLLEAGQGMIRFSHGMPTMQADTIDADLLAFIRS